MKRVIALSMIVLFNSFCYSEEQYKSHPRVWLAKMSLIGSFFYFPNHP